MVMDEREILQTEILNELSGMHGEIRSKEFIEVYIEKKKTSLYIIDSSVPGYVYIIVETDMPDDWSALHLNGEQLLEFFKETALFDGSDALYDKVMNQLFFV